MKVQSITSTTYCGETSNLVGVNYKKRALIIIGYKCRRRRGRRTICIGFNHYEGVNVWLDNVFKGVSGVENAWLDDPRKKLETFSRSSLNIPCHRKI